MSQERLGNTPEILGAPAENFSRGLLGVKLHKDYGAKIEGKVRDNWVVEKDGEQQRIMVTTDRQSAYDRIVCTVPGKGKALNLSSSYWFENTKDIVPNHMIAVPHPNVLIAEQAIDTLPIEMVIRGYMARSSTSTSIYHNYVDLGRREVYGIRFPEGLKANEEFLHPIITPTTKGEVGDHDEELTGEEARDMVDSKFEKGTYEKARLAAIKLFERGVGSHRESGLILVDTKYEFGLDKDGKLMLIDELHTSDSSRIWLKNTYQQKFESGENPDTFDKDILRRNLAENGFRGDGPVPVVAPEVIDEMASAYEVPYRMVTGNNLPETPTNPLELERDIQVAVDRYYNK